MDVTRRTVEGLCRDERILLHAQALPNVGSQRAALDAMEHIATTYPVAAWKTFTHFPGAFERDGNVWWLDDRDGGNLGNGSSGRPCPSASPRSARTRASRSATRTRRPDDIGVVARRHPDVHFVAYHSGFETSVVEGPYTPETKHLGVNRLLASMEREGIGPNENVFAEIGSSWWYLMRYPDQAAHFLGELLKHVGEDNVLWGTDCLFYGSPQPMIQAMRTFRISDELQERHGYPKLTKEIKAKILGLNGAALYGVEPNTETCAFTRRELEELRRTLPGTNAALGPTTMAEIQAFRDDDRELWATTGEDAGVGRRHPHRSEAVSWPRRGRGPSGPRPASGRDRIASSGSMPSPSAHVSPAWNESPLPYVSAIGPGTGAGSYRPSRPSSVA